MNGEEKRISAARTFERRYGFDKINKDTIKRGGKSLTFDTIKKAKNHLHKIGGEGRITRIFDYNDCDVEAIKKPTDSGYVFSHVQVRDGANKKTVAYLVEPKLKSYDLF